MSDGGAEEFPPRRGPRGAWRVADDAQALLPKAHLEASVGDLVTHYTLDFEFLKTVLLAVALR